MPYFWRELSGVTGGGRAYGDDLGFFRHDLERCGVDVGLELGADDSDFYFSVGHRRCIFAWFHAHDERARRDWGLR